ncbi:hypothetical protein H072_4438 [Dactylellina haptotyla CBS 200.50]|uniref:Carboxylic ester hydrolase n=1 Tax=Dactylellina haptotyla (strain CBS 200.50) TaxID=1284197 RepID=S8C223_DACHA|nr:hypothetical protein H072_4438 [Dactylellina haptotyla CBS 200.50]
MLLPQLTVVLTIPYLALAVAIGGGSTSSPQAKTVNGTYEGKYLEGFDQDAFLGMRFGLHTGGQMRFRRPHYVTENWEDVRNATEYGLACPQNPSTNVFKDGMQSEDCLTINVVRPAGTKPGAKLPTLVWIYGGGFDGGGSGDQRYNMSGIVRLSQDMGKPIVGVSFNYRLNKLGFLQSSQLLQEGSSNAGMHDQRLALMWIQANIVAFGGNPRRVTIWGESAGAQAIGLHLHAYDGKDEGLYQAAIMESGGPVGAPVSPMAFYPAYFQRILDNMGCGSAKDQIGCLRSVSFATWQAANSKSDWLVWNPLVDGDMWTEYPSITAAQGKFVKVPILMGTNSDEGCTFAARGLDNETAIYQNLLNYRHYAIRPTMAKKILDLYPDDVTTQPPYYLNPNPVAYPEYGLAWRRAAAIAGDLAMIAPRRRVSEQYTRAGLKVFSYRFDALQYGQNPKYGVGHFQNVVYTFQNISGLLGPLPAYANDKVLSTSMGRAYISFVYDHDPNTSRGHESTLPHWPQYDLKRPKNMVFNATHGSWVENDTYRKKAMAFLNQVDSELQIFA